MRFFRLESRDRDSHRLIQVLHKFDKSSTYLNYIHEFDQDIAEEQLLTQKYDQVDKNVENFQK